MSIERPRTDHVPDAAMRTLAAYLIVDHTHLQESFVKQYGLAKLLKVLADAKARIITRAVKQRDLSPNVDTAISEVGRWSNPCVQGMCTDSRPTCVSLGLPLAHRLSLYGTERQLQTTGPERRTLTRHCSVSFVSNTLNPSRSVSLYSRIRPERQCAKDQPRRFESGRTAKQSAQIK